MKNLGAIDAMETLDMAHAKAGIDSVPFWNRPRLLLDNGPCYILRDLKNYVEERNMAHTHVARYYPQTQGKTERYHCSLKNIRQLDALLLAGWIEAGNRKICWVL